ncbi:MAG: hypothetical protein ACRYGP_13360 [Janthinobacterium lividum]
MANHLSTFLTVSAAAMLLTGSLADAQTRKAPAAKVAVLRGHRPMVIAEMSDASARRPLVIQKRSFLDPGTASTPALGQPEYLASQTTDHQPVYASYNRAFFGESELPRRYDLPYSPSQFGGNNIDFSPLWSGID